MLDEFIEILNAFFRCQDSRRLITSSRVFPTQLLTLLVVVGGQTATLITEIAEIKITLLFFSLFFGGGGGEGVASGGGFLPTFHLCVFYMDIYIFQKTPLGFCKNAGFTSHDKKPSHPLSPI